MCGIAGFVNRECGYKKQDLISICRAMSDSLVHRGPDSSGIWVDGQLGIALGHRRLSILDLSELGNQPMVSSSGRYVIVLNGEIYNFQLIRKELESANCAFKGHSDTEVALAAIELWGIDTALSRFNGMFAFALWDRKERVLRLARDRLGEKPLYYGFARKDFVFASELKAIRAHPSFKPVVNRNAIALFLRHNYIPAPYTIYEGLHKLPAGNMLEIGSDFGVELPLPKPYWNLKTVIEKGLSNSFIRDEQALADQLESLLRDAVKIRMYSDVPLGVFLSGGIDSSLITALMQAQSTQPVRTFTIGFHETGFNEASYASKIAAHLGTAHTQLYVTSQDALKVIPRLSDIYDEPFADSSAIPTYLLSRLTRNYVTVALSGDGGDELFGGYNRYLWCTKLWNITSRIPKRARQGIQAVLRSIPANAWDGMPKLNVQALADKIHKISEVLPIENQQDLYYSLISHWKKPADIVNNSSEPLTAVTNPKSSIRNINSVERMMYTDLCSYLPDDILVKVDRASMASSLEARAVYLDYRVAELAWKIPFSLKIRGSATKWVLRKILDRYVPAGLVKRPKMGFAIPLHEWLRGPLKDWAEELLDEQKLKEDNFFNPAQIRIKWREHLSGKRNWQYHIWIILMFQAWKERWQNSRL